MEKLEKYILETNPPVAIPILNYLKPILTTSVIKTVDSFLQNVYGLSGLRIVDKDINYTVYKATFTKQ